MVKLLSIFSIGLHDGCLVRLCNEIWFSFICYLGLFAEGYCEKNNSNGNDVLKNRYHVMEKSEFDWEFQGGNVFRNVNVYEKP